MENEKNLENLKSEEKKAVAGGDIYYAFDRRARTGKYFVPNPTRKYNGKYYSAARQSLKGAIDHETNAGRGTTIHRYNTIAEAEAAAENEGMCIAANSGDQNAAELLFDTFNDD